MKRKLFVLIVMLFISRVGVAAELQPQVEAPKPAEKKWYEVVTLGGEVRIRDEGQIDYNNVGMRTSYTPGAAARNFDDNFVILRARINIDAKPVDNFRIFIQPQFSKVFGSDGSTIANNADFTSNVDVVDLHQGFIEMSHLGGSVVSLTAGRMELVYGDQRLIGNNDFNNVGRAYDGGKLHLGWEQFWVDGFFTLIQTTGGNQYLPGAYSRWDITETLSNEPYAIGFIDEDGGVGGQALRIVTVGDRFFGKVLDERIDFDVQAAGQFGDSGPNSFLAYAVHAEAGYTFSPDWKPRIGLVFNNASGDDPNTSTVERFNNLFPTNHCKYGCIDFAGWSNIYDFSGGFSIVPVKGLTLMNYYHLFMLPEPSNGMFNAGGTLYRAGSPTASQYAGQEYDFVLDYKFHKWGSVLAGYSFFHGGDFFADTGTSGDAQYVYAQLRASF